MTHDCDILISGGGIAGLTAAAAFGTAGFDVICVDPAPPVTDRDAAGADMRTTAMLQPARDVLAAAGLWDALIPHAAELQIMRIVDAGGELPEPRVTREFDASDISDAPFGWNFPNWLLRREMVARRHPRHHQTCDRGGRPQLPDARGRRDQGQHPALRSKGACLCRHPPNPA